MSTQKANPRRATRRFLAAAVMRAREAWLAHDDRCGAVTGGGCNCTEWERFDWDRSVDDDLCDCPEGLCAGFDGCRGEGEDGHA